MLSFFKDFVPIAQGYTRILRKMLEHNKESIRRREKRVRDLAHPLSRIMDYVIYRSLIELHPSLYEEVFAELFAEDSTPLTRGAVPDSPEA